MIKNKTTQLVYQAIFCTLAVFGILGSLGYFNAQATYDWFNSDFYVYYTNLSNYICMGVMFACLVATIKESNKGEQGYVKTAPKFTFLCVIMILVTFLVYNILLANENTVYDYFTKPSNLLLHVIMPIMFILHWVLFYEHGKVRWYYPLLCVVMPLIYVVFILIRAAIIGSNSASVIYPYFFLDVSNLGWGGFFGWVSVLVLVFVAIGYLFYLFDNIKKVKEKFSAHKNKNVEK